ncbi:HAD family hydrolase [Antrihabitans sp. YC2-6]|uniref:HAD family hydrolase n=1 Tax=Antrihabitans sp. YC2-6 TaxID=2799498 RepID=UPI0018F373E5|nr:HAD family hydrolase [Antrihabitans sp. YC2-6]MBJ8345706.1 HAD family hydrolase [Antrihabitans sp. YC2-6]
MSNQNDAVLFDIDGTLVDSNYLHTVTWSRAFAEVGHAVDSWRIHRAIGMDGSMLVEQLLPGAKEEARQRAKDLHSRYYKESAPALRALSGTRELLQEIASRHLQVVLATSAPEDELAILRDVLGVDEIISAVTSDDDVETAKPRPDIVQVALEKSGVSAHNAVFVGDTEWDAKACVHAGVPFVGVLTGGIASCELQQAGVLAIYDDPADMLEHLDEGPIGRLGRATSRDS